MLDLSASPLDVAPKLLGRILRHAGVAVRLTEVEAYLGEADPASHAHRGVTARTRVMFGPPGHMYVYLSYGMHVAGNIVCHEPGSAGGVLLRAGEVVGGLELARQRRGVRRREGARLLKDHELARGPGCLGQSLGLVLADSGARIAQAGPGDFELSGEPAPADLVRSGPRVGVSRAWSEPWRFWLDGERSVSAYQRSPRALDESSAEASTTES